MTDLHCDTQWMQRAVTLASEQWGTYPNPRVGCVIVRDGLVLGEGAHVVAGSAHAEINALLAANNAGLTAKNATAFVTLEPCNHTGRTGPCVNALIEAGITRVVIGASDPNPVASGGVSVLREYGVDVEVLDDPACLDLLTEFRAWQSQQAFVAIKTAQTIDGYSCDAYGKSQWITGECARERVHWLRSNYGAVAVGATTYRVDNPQLTCRLEGLSPVNTRVVLSRVLPPVNHDPRMIAADGEILVVYHSCIDANRVAWERVGAKLVQVDSMAVDNADVFREMLFAHGIQRLLIEAGPNLQRWVLSNQIAHYAHVMIAPKLLLSGNPNTASNEGLSLEKAIIIANPSVRELATDVEIHGCLT